MIGSTRMFPGAVVTLAACGAASMALAAGAGDAVQVSQGSEEPGDHCPVDPETAITDAGVQLVFWGEVEGACSGARRLWGRIVGPDGQPDGEQFAISEEPFEGTRDFVTSAAVAASGRGEIFLVVWTQRRPNGHDEVVARWFDARGQATSPEFLVTPTKAQSPAVAYSSERREFLVTWTGYAKPGIYAARLSEESSRTPTRFRVYSNRDAEIVGSAVAYNARRENYMVVWDERQLRGRTVPERPAGKLGRVRQLSAIESQDGEPLAPSIAFSARANEYALAWSRGVKFDEEKVFVRRVGPRGRVLARKVLLDEFAGGAVIGARRHGGYLVAYGDGGPDPDAGQIIYSRRLTSRLESRRRSTVSSGRSDQSAANPALAYSPADARFHAAWIEGRAGSSSGFADFEVFTRRL